MHHHTLTGQCCAHTHITLHGPHPSCCYAPRLCQCDYCTQKGVPFVAEPQGQAIISSTGSFHIDTFDSEQALFMRCQFCDTLIATSVEIKDNVNSGFKASLNAHLFDDTHFKPAQKIALSKLTPHQKYKRWMHLLTPVNFNFQPNAIFISGSLLPGHSHHHWVQHLMGEWTKATLFNQSVTGFLLTGTELHKQLKNNEIDPNVRDFLQIQPILTDKDRVIFAYTVVLQA